MDFTNINDPAGVQALLDQLRTSQAWQDLNTAPENTNGFSHVVDAEHPPVVPPSTGPERSEPGSSPVSNHISSLLSRLRPESSAFSSSSPAPRYSNPHPEPTFSSRPHPPRANGLTPEPGSRLSPPKNKRSLNFNQALPVIARLSEDSVFMAKLDKMREDQTTLERKLWEERTRILKAQEEKLKVAHAKAMIIGAGLSQSDASSFGSSFQQELKLFDLEVLSAWDALIAKQQAALEALGVPGVFVTALKAEREKQQRIIQVLDGLSGPGDDMES